MGLDPLSLAASATAQGLGGLISLVGGISQKHKANKLLKGLTYPNEEIPSEVTANQNLAQNMASTGLPSEQYNMAMKNIQRQQMAALRASNDRRLGAISIPSIIDAGNNAIGNLDVANANARINNQRQLMNVNNQVAGWKDRVWQHNVADKYNRDYQYAMALKGMGNQNLFGGLDQLGAAAGSALAYGGGGGQRRRNPTGATITGSLID